MTEEKIIDPLKKTDSKIWRLPSFPDVTNIKQVAVDLETYDRRSDPVHADRR